MEKHNETQRQPLVPMEIGRKNCIAATCIRLFTHSHASLDKNNLLLDNMSTALNSTIWFIWFICMHCMLECIELLYLLSIILGILSTSLPSSLSLYCFFFAQSHDNTETIQLISASTSFSMVLYWLTRPRHFMLFRHFFSTLSSGWIEQGVDCILLDRNLFFFLDLICSVFGLFVLYAMRIANYTVRKWHFFHSRPNISRFFFCSSLHLDGARVRG